MLMIWGTLEMVDLIVMKNGKKVGKISTKPKKKIKK